jgi:hypothetical protein
MNVGGALRAATGNSEHNVRPSETASHVQKLGSGRNTSSFWQPHAQPTSSESFPSTSLGCRKNRRQSAPRGDGTFSVKVNVDLVVLNAPSFGNDPIGSDGSTSCFRTSQQPACEVFQIHERPLGLSRLGFRTKPIPLIFPLATGSSTDRSGAVRG